MSWAAVAGAALAAEVGLSIYKALNPPKIKVETPHLDENLLSQLKTKINSMSTLSDVARVNVTEALEKYRKGELTPQYKAMLDRWWKENLQKLEQTLAARGLSHSSVAMSALQDLSAKYQELAGQLLQKQLYDSLRIAGLTDADIRQIEQTLNLDLRAQAYRAQTELEKERIKYGVQNSAMNTLGSTLSSFAQLFGRQSGSSSGTATGIASLGGGGLKQEFDENKLTIG